MEEATELLQLRGALSPPCVQRRDSTQTGLMTNVNEPFFCLSPSVCLSVSWNVEVLSLMLIGHGALCDIYF